MRQKHHGQKAKAAGVGVARSPEKNPPIKVPAGDLNRQERIIFASIGAATPQAKNNPSPNGIDKRRLLSLCHWTLAQARNRLRSYRSLS